MDRFGAAAVYRIGSTATYKKIFRYWYPFMTRRLVDNEDVFFLNWGYEEDPPLGLPLEDSDETDRYHIQLYHQTASQVDLSGKEVLEVSCGHGGGASFVVRTLKPVAYVGLDFNASAIEYCRKRHRLPGLTFVQGDAQNLPFPDESFDAVINVEASHIYPDFDAFVAEVARVLRPGGHFLHADFRNRDNFDSWESGLNRPPLRLISKKIISDEVLRGLRLNSPRSSELIDRYSPPLLRRFGREFAVVDGSMFYKDLERGELSYRIYCLTKSGAGN